MNFIFLCIFYIPVYLYIFIQIFMSCKPPICVSKTFTNTSANTFAMTGIQCCRGGRGERAACLPWCVDKLQGARRGIHKGVREGVYCAGASAPPRRSPGAQPLILASALIKNKNDKLNQNLLKIIQFFKHIYTCIYI